MMAGRTWWNIVLGLYRDGMCNLHEVDSLEDSQPLANCRDADCFQCLGVEGAQDVTGYLVFLDINE
jgi:hypothetical protein